MTRLSKSHFELIAGVLRNAIERERVQDRLWENGEDHPSISDAISDLCADFSNALADTNPQFDRARFLAACQPSEEQ